MNSKNIKDEQGLPPYLENLTGRRIRFRALRDEDMKHHLEFLSQKEAIRYLFIDEDLDEYCRKWFKRQKERYKESRMGLCAVELKETGEFIGQCGLILQQVDGGEELEVGYHFLPRHWGNGYATEAAVMCRDYAFSHGLAESVISLIYIDNTPSQRVAVRNGMKVDRRTEFMNLPMDMYRITRAQWEQHAAAPACTALAVSHAI
ncbi:MAG: GNAT family N-acetyltransferase [bacterium]|nr:GNAT family N-acetyltransferase [bacterium]